MLKTIYADCRDFLPKLKDNCIDALATDSPYGLGFMNKSWDKEVPGSEYWTEILKVLKPGAYGVAMGAPRLYHRLACAIEDSGFEIRDCIMWLYGSGFPKSHNVALGIDKQLGVIDRRGRAIPTASSYQACGTPLTANKVDEYIAQTEEALEWQDYGTALKPAYEPILLIRKPLIGNVAENVLTYGVGGLNIGACRIGDEEVIINRFTDGMKPFGNGAGHEYSSETSKGRWPANICHDGSDEVVGLFPNVKSVSGGVSTHKNDMFNMGKSVSRIGYDDSGSAARFFYCSKASRKERELGLHERDPINVTDGRNKPTDNPYQRGKTQRLNTHPSVKPIALCRWLSRLICPSNSKTKILIDPFMGSGSFGCAAALEGFNWIGVDNDKESVDIAEKRVAYWQQQTGNI